MFAVSKGNVYLITRFHILYTLVLDTKLLVLKTTLPHSDLLSPSISIYTVFHSLISYGITYTVTESNAFSSTRNNKATLSNIENHFNQVYRTVTTGLRCFLPNHYERTRAFTTHYLSHDRGVTATITAFFVHPYIRTSIRTSIREMSA